MAKENEGGGGFGWGLLVGAALGFVAGVVLASGPGRDRVESIRLGTIDLTDKARRVARDADHPIGRAISEGRAATNRRRQELERAARGLRHQVGEAAGEAAPDA